MASKMISDLTEITEFSDSEEQHLILESPEGTKIIKAVNFYVATKKLFGSAAAAEHNAQPRGKDLTDIYSVDDICDMIAAETYEDIYPGDYFTTTITTSYGGSENVDIMIGGFDMHRHLGDTEDDTPSALCVLKDAFSTTAQMESSATTANGYAGSAMHTTVLPVYATALKAAIGDHVLSHRRLLTDGISSSGYSMVGDGLTGYANSWSWSDTELCLMNEVMLYGCHPNSSSRRDIGDMTQQIPVFRYFPDLKVSHLGKGGSRCDFWLSAVASSTYFAHCGSYGGASGASASHSYGVRPYFLLA